MSEARRNIFPGKTKGGPKRSVSMAKEKAGRSSARFGREPCRGNPGFGGGSACVMQGAKFLDQQFAGDQFQLEIKRALHENLYGFLLGHGILLPWE